MADNELLTGRQHASRRGLAGIVLGMLAVIAGAVAFAWRPREKPADENRVTSSAATSASTDSADDDPLDKPIVRPAGYVGPQACAACHAERWAEFQTTRHFLACVLPQADEMPAGFEPGKGTYQTRDPSLRFEMSRQGETFVQTAIQTTAEGEQRSTAPIGLVYGYRAKTDEVYFNWRENQLYELPMVWLHPQNTWGTSSFDTHGSGDFSRALSPRCLECHTTWMGHVPGTVNEYRKDDLILGVTCEVCHGPGQDHVMFHRAHPDDKAAHDIVRPGQLNRQQQLDLCSQCHSNAIKHRGPAFSYRPGEPLDAHFKTLETKYSEEDHVANQTSYMRQSKCFQKSGSLTCTTCHNPHRPRDPVTSGSVACRKCHQAADCAEQSRVPEAVRDQCSRCHMPAFNKTQVHFRTEQEPYVPPVKRWEHRIAVYPAARDEVLLEWHRTQTDEQSRNEVTRLSKGLAEHWLRDADQFRNDYRFLPAIDAYRQSLKFDPAPTTRDKLNEVLAMRNQIDADWSLALKKLNAPAEASELFNRILSLKPDHPRAHGRLGTMLATQGQQELAIEHWRKVSECDPNDSYGEGMLGWNAYLQGRYVEAIAALQRADEIEPFNAKINLNLGLALSRAGRIPEAIEHFQKVVTIEPQNVDGFYNLSMALRNQGQPNEAIRFAVRAVKLTQHQNADLLIALAETYLEAGHVTDASNVAEKAAERARTTNSKLLPQLRALQERLQKRIQRTTN